jgi:hypothetical protein
VLIPDIPIFTLSGLGIVSNLKCGSLIKELDLALVSNNEY